MLSYLFQLLAEFDLELLGYTTNTVNRVTFGFGVVAVLLSFSWFLFYIRSRHKIARSVAFMLLGETCANLSTTLFAAEQLFPAIVFSVTFKTTLRWVIFIPVVFSTMHLAMVTKEIIDEKEQNEKTVQ